MIELDQPLGRNDGTVDGHFYCQLKPKHGIFVRPIKVARLVDGATTEASTSTSATSVEAPLPSAGTAQHDDAHDDSGALAEDTCSANAANAGNSSSATLQNITNSPQPEHNVPYPAWMRSKFADAP